jgi:hypothetical protein
MKIYSVQQIGEYHINHCEDYLVIEEIGNNRLLCAVMDGCTMGIDSYFASTLVGKILRKIAKTKGYMELYSFDSISVDIETMLKSIMKELFSELNITRQQLLLDTKELLTTLIILLVDKKSNTGVVMVIGDGLISINGEVTEFDQENKPDYIGFHLSDNFETWYGNQTQKIPFSTISDISIATDGIMMFDKVYDINIKETINPIQFLIQDKSAINQDDMLELKLKKLEHVYGLKPTDDLALIRLIV